MTDEERLKLQIEGASGGQWRYRDRLLIRTSGFSIRVDDELDTEELYRADARELAARLIAIADEIEGEK